MSKKREMCPICTKKTGTAEHQEKRWAKEPCPECAELKKKGFVLIGAVEKKTTDVTNPYRSGNIYVVAQEVADDIFKPHGAPKSGVAFVDVNILSEMKFPDVNINA